VTGTLFDKPITLDSKRYRDVYEPDVRLQGLLGYGIGERVEIIARGTYYKADGTALEVGNLDGDPVYAFFDPYGSTRRSGSSSGCATTSRRRDG